ncbi:MAG: hypothetical protein SPE55_07040, partial [Sodaliphilus sp.]|nr:hypothetical protein [Sodaliphilus sp.]
RKPRLFLERIVNVTLHKDMKSYLNERKFVRNIYLGTLFLYFKTDLLDTIQEMTGIILLYHGGSALVCFSVLKRQVT